MTAPPTLYWNVLRWNLDVERVQGQNVEYTGSKSSLPILVLQCSKGGHLERGPCQTEEKFGISTGIHSPGPWVPCASMQNPRVRVERFLRSMKQQKESDRVTL